MNDIKPKPRPVEQRRYRRAEGGPINQRVDYLEHTRYDDGTSTLMAHFTNGKVGHQSSWNFKDAESLVSTGNWKVDVYRPYDDDVPETRGDEVAW